MARADALGDRRAGRPERQRADARSGRMALDRRRCRPLAVVGTKPERHLRPGMDCDRVLAPADARGTVAGTPAAHGADPANRPRHGTRQTSCARSTPSGTAPFLQSANLVVDPACALCAAAHRRRTLIPASCSSVRRFQGQCMGPRARHLPRGNAGGLTPLIDAGAADAHANQFHALRPSTTTNLPQNPWT